MYILSIKYTRWLGLQSDTCLQFYKVIWFLSELSASVNFRHQISHITLSTGCLTWTPPSAFWCIQFKHTENNKHKWVLPLRCTCSWQIDNSLQQRTLSTLPDGWKCDSCILCLPLCILYTYLTALRARSWADRKLASCKWFYLSRLHDNNGTIDFHFC